MKTFCNPLLAYGPDPYATFHDGWYYVMVTEHDRLAIRRTWDLTDLRNAERRVIGKAPFSDECYQSIWAPELHRIDGSWYVYFTGNTADDNDRNRRLFVMECLGPDPMQSEWRFAGRLKLPTDRYSIDATVLQDGERRYLIWSSKLTRADGWYQHIMITPLITPVSTGDFDVILSAPTMDWERHDHPVNEGPQVLQRGNDIFVAFSASAYWTPNYAIGLLQTRSGLDLMDIRNWKKHPQPFFQQSQRNGVYGCGHNSFIQSPDKTEWWNLYHARSSPGVEKDGDTRNPRLQRIDFDSSGLPIFGEPLPIHHPIPKPSGT
jgi:GH43 family beta-xylosidase